MFKQLPYAVKAGQADYLMHPQTGLAGCKAGDLQHLLRAMGADSTGTRCMLAPGNCQSQACTRFSGQAAIFRQSERARTLPGCRVAVLTAGLLATGHEPECHAGPECTHSLDVLLQA